MKQDEAVWRERFAPLARSFALGGLELANRIVISPMTRGRSSGGVLDGDAVAYYGARAAGGAGLIISEGAAINRRGAFSANVPDFFGDDSLAVWGEVIGAVHAAGGRMMPQLWHAGLNRWRARSLNPEVPSLSPSGSYPGNDDGSPGSGPSLDAMTQADIDQTIDDYAQAALAARRLGFDGVALHGGHGYLIDSFFWERSNHRQDRYGGDIAARTRFAVEVIEEMRRRVGSAFPIALRFSQWKSPEFYSARLCENPAELERLLTPLVEAGISLFDCSTRRFWEPEFPEQDARLNLAGWTRKITGVPTMTVGSVGIGQPLDANRHDRGDAVREAVRRTIAEAAERVAAGEFDLVAIGRGSIANPDWARKVIEGRVAELTPYNVEMRGQMV